MCEVSLSLQDIYSQDTFPLPLVLSTSSSKIFPGSLVEKLCSMLYPLGLGTSASVDLCDRADYYLL